MIRFYLFLSIAVSFLQPCSSYKAKQRDNGMKDLIKQLDGMLDGNEKSCVQLNISYLERHMLIQDERFDYCRWGCKFLDLTCGDTHGENRRSFMSKESLAANSEYILEWADSYGDTDIMRPDISEHVLIDLKYVGWRMAPLVFSFPPLLFSRYFKSAFPFIFYTLVFLSIATTFNYGYVTIFYVIYVTGASSVFHNAANVFHEAAVSVFILAFCMCGVIVTDVFIQFASVVVLILSYILLLKRSFHDKKVNALTVIMYMLQIAVSIEHLTHIKHTFSPDTLGYHVFWMLIGTVFPQESRNSSYLLWSIFSSACVTDKISSLGIHLDGGLFIFLFLQIAAFLSFRALYGMYIMRSLRLKMDLHVLIEGLYIYSIDLFGGIITVTRLLTGRDKMNHRRILYVALSSSIIYFEFLNAVEVFYFRLLLSVTDLGLIHSDYSRFSRHLGSEISFEFCDAPVRSLLQNAFPQKGAVPWVSVDNITRCCDYVKSISVRRGDSTYRGEGFLTRNTAGRMFLLSVHHMFPSGSSLTIDNNFFGDVKPRCLNDVADPVVSVDLGHCDEYGDLFAEAPIISNITNDELDNTRMLVFLNSNEGDGGMVNFTDRFKVDKYNGGFSVSVDLKKGDSGGPVLAIMDSGQLRYAGAVSKGNSNMNSGNFISWAVQKERNDELSSDDDDYCTFGTGRSSKFNVKRSRPVTNDQLDRVRIETINQLRSFIKANAELFADADRLPYKPNIKDFEDDVSLSAMKHEVQETIKELEGSRKNSNNSDGEGFSGGSSSRRRNPKSKNKDRAAKKRAVTIYSEALSARRWKKIYDVFFELQRKLKTVYHEKDANNIFKIMMKGNIPNLKWEFFEGNECTDDYIYADDDVVRGDPKNFCGYA